MHVKRIHEMLECITKKALSEIENGVENINAEEFSMATDMIKDLAEAEYYAKITVAMEESGTEEIMDMFDRYGEDRRYYDNYRYKTSGRFAPKGKGTYMPRRGYEEPPYYHMTPEYMMGIDDYKKHSPEYWRDKDRDKGIMYYTEPMHDGKDGRSWKSRRGYMESKELHKANTPEDKQHKMKELEKYMSELSSDVTEMIADASPEERSLLKQKLQVLTQKIG